MMRGADRWLWPCLTAPSWPLESVSRVFLAVTDHFEPFHHAERDEALRRMELWQRAFPASISDFADATGRKPRHTFFYPIEQYDEEVIARLADLCGESGSEVEVHLHHHDDTAVTLRDKLDRGVEALMSHGLLSRAADGSGRFCFIHGDWALANCHPLGRHCGVPEEIRILREAGCVADFTFPSAPSPTQPRRVNSIYYTADTGNPQTLASGVPLRLGQGPACRDAPYHLLLVHGVTAMNWHRRKWGLLPRLENSDLTMANPPTPERWRLWLRHAPRVAGRPDWAFIKLHTHGAPPPNCHMLLGQPMRAFREYLATLALPVHFVTAREMVNVLHALEDGAQDFDERLLVHRYPAPPL